MGLIGGSYRKTATKQYTGTFVPEIWEINQTMDIRQLIRQAWLITMANIDMERFKVFADRCFVAEDRCMYINIGEHRHPMKITDELHPDLAGSKPDAETILDILRSVA